MAQQRKLDSNAQLSPVIYTSYKAILGAGGRRFKPLQKLGTATANDRSTSFQTVGQPVKTAVTGQAGWPLAASTAAILLHIFLIKVPIRKTA